jgi:hypothetical protein
MHTRASVSCLALVLAFGVCGVARAGTGGDTRPQGAAKSDAAKTAKPEAKLAAMRARRSAIKSNLAPPMREWLTGIASSHRSALLDAPEPAVKSISAQIHAQRPKLTQQQVDLLTFYVASSVVSPKDSLGEINSQQQLQLQLTMQQQQKLLETISDLMKKSSDTSAAIVQNMK